MLYNNLIEKSIKNELDSTMPLRINRTVEIV